MRGYGVSCVVFPRAARELHDLHVPTLCHQLKNRLAGWCNRMERWETFHRTTKVNSSESGATRVASSNGASPVIQVSFDGNCASSSQSAYVGGSSSLITINSESQCSEQSDSELSEGSEEVTLEVY